MSAHDVQWIAIFKIPWLVQTHRLPESSCREIKIISVQFNPLKRQSRLQQTTLTNTFSLFFFFFFQRKQDLIFHVNPLLGRGFTWNIKPYFLRKIKEKKIKCRLLQFLLGALRVKIKKSTLWLQAKPHLCSLKAESHRINNAANSICDCAADVENAGHYFYSNPAHCMIIDMTFIIISINFDSNCQFR